MKHPHSSCSIEYLLSDCEHYTIGDESTLVGGIAYDSRDVCPGDAFFCIVGENSDGHAYVQNAIEAGAAAIVCQRKAYLGDGADAPMAIVPSTRKAMSLAAARLYGMPSQRMNVVGITGTNGKTTTTYLVQHVLESLGRKCGLIGTTGIKMGGSFVPCSRTTPESADLQHILGEMAYDSGCSDVVMEVSSHALALDRTWGMDFAVTAFTNLTQDHLDYHHTFDEYFEAKAKLFDTDYPAVRVINVGDEYGQKLCEKCRERGDTVITYSFFEDGDIHPQNVSYKSSSTSSAMRVFDRTYTVEYPLVGQYNLENVMCAIGICLALGHDAKDVVKALNSKISVPGRLEHVGLDVGEEEKKACNLPEVYVDYAHTPDAVSKAAGAVRALRKDPMKSRSIVVLGCGGDRDKSKRPLMGQAAVARSDYAVITSDNPRTEDPDAIISDIVAGLAGKNQESRFEVVSDRRKAIQKAVDIAGYGDVVLLAGKGHEDYQIVGQEKLHFDDREEARTALQKKKERRV